MALEALRVDGARLRRSLEELATIGATPGGGVQRLTLTDEDRRGRDLFVKWLREIDLDVTIDEMGNIFGRRVGRRPELPPIVTGSHLDSQPEGGRFDGALGVMGGLEVMRTVHENHVQTERSVVVVDWTNEEGSRFSPAMMASGVWAGKLDRDWIYSRTDMQGKVLVDELERIGYRGSLPAERWPFAAYYELHIEQGPKLERAGCTIGIPKGIFCLHWYDVYLEGKANQVGPTPMEGRNDALCAAAEMILAVQSVPTRMGGNMVATVGQIENRPNSRNIIPNGAHFTVDIRSWDDDLAIAAWEQLERDCTAAAKKNGCPLRMEQTWRVEHVAFAAPLVERLTDVAAELGYSINPMVSGAGHDAGYMAMVGPTAMIFVPSIDGRSHVEVEATDWDDCTAGVNVLLHSIVRSANET